MNEYKEEFLQNKTIKKWEESRKKRRIALKSSLKYLGTIKTVLTKNKAKKFTAVKLTQKDAYLKDEQKNHYHYKQTREKSEDIKFHYGPIEDVSSHQYYWRHNSYPEKDNESYHKVILLFLFSFFLILIFFT